MDNSHSIRQQWLKAFVITILVQIFLILFYLELEIRCSLLIQLYINKALLYFFAYQKKGTKWLLFTLVLMPISLLLEFFALRSTQMYFNFLINVCLSTFFWIRSKRFWEYNRALKKVAKVDLM